MSNYIKRAIVLTRDKIETYCFEQCPNAALDQDHKCGAHCKPKKLQTRKWIGRLENSVKRRKDIWQG